MWTSVHKAMFELDPKVTHKIFRNWICAISDEENSSILYYILENVEYKPDYYDKLLKIVGSEFISDASLLMPMVNYVNYVFVVVTFFFKYIVIL